MKKTIDFPEVRKSLQSRFRNLITDVGNFLTRTVNLWKALENYTSEENSPEKKNSTWDSSGVPESQKLNFPDNGALY